VIHILDVLEYRFVVPGRAVSFRSPKAKAHKVKVRGCLPARLKKRPIRESCEIRLDYFHTSPRRFDMDNVAKCVLDAMNNVAYTDDQLARLQSATAHDLTRRFTLRSGPVDLVKPLRVYLDYLVVRVRIAG
jgi:Holliday junction resolvase RusA-like endonuclease